MKTIEKMMTATTDDFEKYEELLLPQERFCRGPLLDDGIQNLLFPPIILNLRQESFEKKALYKEFREWYREQNITDRVPVVEGDETNPILLTFMDYLEKLRANGS